MQTMWQEWKLLCRGIRIVRISTGSMLNASQQEWKMMSRQFMTCWCALSSLTPIHSTHLIQRWDRCNLACLQYQSLSLISGWPYKMAKLRQTILHERVFTKTRSLTATIHRNKRRNFASDQICVHSGASMNVALMERSGMVALVDLAESVGMVKLESALEGRVTEECLSVFNVDGSMRKTCKSKLLQLFSMEPVTEITQGYTSLVDMGLIWRLATPTPEDREAKRRWLRVSLDWLHG